MGELPKIPKELVEQWFPEGFNVRDEANALVAWAFRNGPLENLHAGKDSKLLRDDSLSRITDAEMRDLMISAAEKLEDLLRLKETDSQRYDVLIKSYNIMFCSGWER